jgi:hypothetical protein
LSRAKNIFRLKFTAKETNHEKEVEKSLPRTPIDSILRTDSNTSILRARVEKKGDAPMIRHGRNNIAFCICAVGVLKQPVSRSTV